jgi:DNA modification methylase
MRPYYEDDVVAIYHGDCRELLPELPPAHVVITDPPYPNQAGHFEAQICGAVDVLKNYQCKQWLVFWDEMSTPPISLPLVARHIWHRTNTNRPDNYEAIFEFNRDGIKRASRVLPFAVIAPGLTGCNEATGHPTQKSKKLLAALITQSGMRGPIYDPFMGSGTTLRAAKDLGIKAIGIEINEGYCEVAAKRMAQEVFQFNGLAKIESKGPELFVI